MDEYESLSHSQWECKYHVIFIPKCGRKTLYQGLRPHLGEVFRRLAEQRQSRVEEGHLMSDHVYILLSIPPKYAVSQVVGYMKGKSAIPWRESMVSVSRTLSGSIFGREAILCPRWAVMKRWFGPTFATRRRKISGSIN